MARIKLKEFIDKLIKSEVKTAFWVSWLAFVVVVGFTFIFFKYKGDFLRNIFIEAHGMLFDLFIIATFILWLNKKAEKKRNIQRWQEEIDDFRFWDEKEATFRIVGNIRRLNKNGITEIDLYRCFLKQANLMGATLKGADLGKTNLIGADLGAADLEGADLNSANLEGAALDRANLKEAILIVANLKEAILGRANLKEADLRRAKLEKAELIKADLSGADFYGADLSGADFEEAILRRVKRLTLEQLSKVRTLYLAKLDSELENQIKEKHPHLLEMPEFPKEEVDE